MSDEPDRLVNICSFLPDGGAAHRIWYLTEGQAEAIAEALGEPNEERIQTAAEAQAAHEITGGYETPPLIREAQP